jgi:hypothetical protein
MYHLPDWARSIRHFTFREVFKSRSSPTNRDIDTDANRVPSLRDITPTKFRLEGYRIDSQPILASFLNIGLPPIRLSLEQVTRLLEISVKFEGDEVKFQQEEFEMPLNSGPTYD